MPSVSSNPSTSRRSLLYRACHLGPSLPNSNSALLIPSSPPSLRAFPPPLLQKQKLSIDISPKSPPYFTFQLQMPFKSQNLAAKRNVQCTRTH